MRHYEPGDYVKVEFKVEGTGDSEWMWVKVDSCDEVAEILFGELDSQPVAHSEKLKLGQRLAVKFNMIREHRKSNEFA
jgi:hypothetical protein